MSEYHSPDAEAHYPRFEPWLAVLGTAFIPAVLVVYVPDAFHLPLIGVTALLVIAGLTMLVRHTRSVTRGRDAHRVSS